MLSAYRGNSAAPTGATSNKAVLVTLSGSSGPGICAGEVPTGTQNGVNPTFTLANSTAIAASLILQLNGVVLKPGVGYTLSGQTITMQSGYIPQSDDVFYANYQYTP